MGNPAEQPASIMEELEKLARGSLTDGYQTAIMEVMRRVEEAMDEQNVSRSDLAERLNVHPSRVTRLLDDPDNITLRTLWRVCIAVGLHPSISVETSG